MYLSLEEVAEKVKFLLDHGVDFIFILRFSPGRNSLPQLEEEK